MIIPILGEPKPNEVNGVMYRPMIGAARSTEQGLEIEMATGHELTGFQVFRIFGQAVFKVINESLDEDVTKYSKFILKEYIAAEPREFKNVSAVSLNP